MGPRTITVEAVGQCEATRKLATVEASIISDGESASDARAMVKDRVATLRESITNASTEQLKTVDIQVLDTDEMFEPVTDASFQATERINVNCVPETVESVVIDIINAGGQIQSVRFQIHEAKHQELQNEALSSAMERARKKAEQIAAVESVTVAKIQQATMKDVSTGFESIVDEALASNSGTNLHPTPVTISEGVEVVYEISEE